MRAGRDGSDKHNGRLFFEMIKSDDMTSIHTSSHKVYGGPCDSGRAEMIGNVVILYYLTELMEYMNPVDHKPIMIYCDNMEAVNFATNTWLGTTPRWADERKVDIKCFIQKFFVPSRHIFKIEHIKR